MSLPVPKQDKEQRDKRVIPESYLQFGPSRSFDTMRRERQAAFQPSFTATTRLTLPPLSHQEVVTPAPSELNAATSRPPAVLNVPAVKLAKPPWSIEDELELMKIVARLNGVNPSTRWSRVSSEFNVGKRPYRPVAGLRQKYYALRQQGSSVDSVEQKVEIRRTGGGQVASRLESAPSTLTFPLPSQGNQKRVEDPVAEAIIAPTTTAPMTRGPGQWNIQDELHLMRIVVPLRANPENFSWSKVHSAFNGAQRQYRSPDALLMKYDRLRRAGESIASLEQKLESRWMTSAPQ